jgi:hypothetical protein
MLLNDIVREYLSLSTLAELKSVHAKYHFDTLADSIVSQHAAEWPVEDK